MPVIVKLTPNITDIRRPARAAHKGGADAVSLINTINSITAINLDTFSPEPSIDGKGIARRLLRPGGEADRARHGVGDRARPGDAGSADLGDRRHHHLARRGRVHLARRGTVQVCTAAMAYGFRIVKEMISGLERWMDEKGYTHGRDFRGRAVQNVTDWQYLNLNYVAKARIDQDLCIKCGRCHIVCEDTSHQAITHTVAGKRHFEVIDAECVGCNLCVAVCPVQDCITMEPLPAGAIDPRTGTKGRARSTPTGPRTRTTRWRGRRRSSQAISSTVSKRATLPSISSSSAGSKMPSRSFAGSPGK